MRDTSRGYPRTPQNLRIWGWNVAVGLAEIQCCIMQTLFLEVFGHNSTRLGNVRNRKSARGACAPQSQDKGGWRLRVLAALAFPILHESWGQGSQLDLQALYTFLRARGFSNQHGHPETVW